jgi:hypothetical protein
VLSLSAVFKDTADSRLTPPLHQKSLLFAMDDIIILISVIALPLSATLTNHYHNIYLHFSMLHVITIMDKEKTFPPPISFPSESKKRRSKLEAASQATILTYLPTSLYLLPTKHRHHGLSFQRLQKTLGIQQWR